VGADQRGAGVVGHDQSGHHPSAGLDPEKKTLTASERDETVRAAWRERITDIAASRFVFVDETGSHTALTRRFGWAPRGQRAVGSAPRNHGVNRTTITSLTLNGLGPGLSLEGGVTTRGFEVYVERILASQLRPGQIVVLDNLRQHQSQRTRALIEACGAELWFLPSYSPDLNPIEEAFSKVKMLLRTAAARSHEALVTAIWDALAAITPTDALGYIAHCGYHAQAQLS
jgi:transposase